MLTDADGTDQGKSLIARSLCRWQPIDSIHAAVSRHAADEWIGGADLKD
jgi:hypothetical protein